MKSLLERINEATEKTMWVAVEVVTPADYYHDKPRRSQRVVTLETFNDLKEGRKKRTKAQGTNRWGEKYDYMDNPPEVTELGRSYDREEAESFLDKSNKTKRKSKIDKGNAKYIVYAISMGKMNPTGKTQFGWSVFDDEYKDNEIYMLGNNYFLWGAAGSLKKGDTICLVDNDSEKKLPIYGGREVSAISKSTYDDFVKVYRGEFPNSCKRPSYQFGKKSDGLPWTNTIRGIYSIKGISE